MSLIQLVKKVRQILNQTKSVVFGLWELVVGGVVSILTGRFCSTHSGDEPLKVSLIVCPSPLLNTMPINHERRDEYIISFLNSACLSPTFVEVKPDRMFLVDPVFFRPVSSWPESSPYLNDIVRILDMVSGKTDWALKVVVPWHYRNSEIAKRMAENPNVTIQGIPVFNARGTNSVLRNLGFQLGVLNPVYQNVLIAAIFFSLKVGHKKTVLWGAHHTWLKEVEVDSKNQVLHSVRHTEDQTTGQVLRNPDGTLRPYHRYLQQLSTVFEQYHVLREFADRNDQDIINATGESFVDAFRRCNEIGYFGVEE